MGVDKALIEIDGTPMAERVARALEAGGCAPVVFVAGERGALTTSGRTWLADRWPGAGPLGGVLTALTALTAAGSDGVLVAACDLPALDEDTVAAVLRAARAHPNSAAVVAETDRIEPLLSWWPAASLSALEAAWSAGTRAVHDVLDALGPVRVPVPASALRNANRPEDLDGITAPADGAAPDGHG
jgi:molybdopterin-guanine dinucleotide biosynthesis protein A